MPALGQALGHGNEHETAEVKKENNSLQQKRKETLQAVAGLYKKLKMYVLPQKWPSFGVTFHFDILMIFVRLDLPIL